MNPPTKPSARVKPSQPTLHDLARRRIASGTLPRFTGVQVSAGHGPEADCALCGRHIERHDLQYIVVRPHDGTPVSRHFHVPCFLAWESVSLIEMPPQS